MALLSAANSTPIPAVVRPISKFSPSIWGDRFSSFSINNQVWDTYSNEIDVLKEEVRSMLVAAGTSSEKMNLINTIERLGISYHFHAEIEELVKNLFHDHAKFVYDKDYDLFNTALSFRIFRQHDVFNKFKDSTGKFEEALAGDAMGMLSFYDATHLRMHDEVILDDALAFTTSHLGTMASDLNSAWANIARRALEMPLHKGIPRVEAKFFISLYEEDPSKNELLLRLAKLDFNMLQMLHKQELSQLSRWWNDLDLASKLPYSRNRIVEGYFWAVAVQFEPGYSLARSIFAKMVTMLTVQDDTYDSYATFEEIEVHWKAIQRWDISIVHELPDYMRVFYRALLNLFVELDEEMTKQGKSHRIHYVKEAFNETVRAYYIEAKWLNENYMPLFDEYLSNALTSTGLCMLGLSYFVGLGEDASNLVFDRTLIEQKFVAATCLCGRLMDDIVDQEDVQDDITGIDCYMTEHGVSKEETVSEFRTRLENTWKVLNEELMRPTSFPMSLIKIFQNLMRMMFVTYKHEDGYTHPEPHLKDYIVALFVDAIPI